MSDVADAAIVQLFLADYAAADTAGKLNVVGGHLNTVGYLAETGHSAPFTLVVSVQVPPNLYNAECAMEVVLEDSAGNVVTFPNPAGQSTKMQVGQAVTFAEPPSTPGLHVPRHTLRARTNWIMGFANGLPLATGQKYIWKVRIDGEGNERWTEEFYVPGMAPQPVIG